jgi:hypothetical protein
METFINLSETTLGAAITDTSGNSITVASSTGFPTDKSFRICIDDELMLVTAVSGTTWTVQRGVESTTAATHQNGAKVIPVLTAQSKHIVDRNIDLQGNAITTSSGNIQVTTTNAQAIIMGNGNTIYGGNNNTIVGGKSNQIGTQFSSYDYSTICGGSTNVVTNSNSTALGYHNTISGQTAFSCGGQNTSSGTGSFTCGYGNVASGNYAFACGSSTEAKEMGSFAAGMYTKATAYYSVAFGDNSAAISDCSYAAGYFALAYNKSQRAMGASSYNYEFTVQQTDVCLAGKDGTLVLSTSVLSQFQPKTTLLGQFSIIATEKDTKAVCAWTGGYFIAQITDLNTCELLKYSLGTQVLTEFQSSIAITIGWLRDGTDLFYPGDVVFEVKNLDGISTNWAIDVHTTELPYTYNPSSGSGSS